MNKFRVEYDNDTGPNDEGFWEYWTVTNDERSFRVDSSKQDAEWLADALNAAPAPAVPDGFELNLAVAESAIRKLVMLCPVTPPEAACMQSVVVGARAMLAAQAKGASHD